MKTISIYYIVIAAYVIAVFGISGIFIKKSKVSYEEYTVASKSLGFTYTFFTYFSTWLSGSIILGLAAMSFKWGLYQYWFIAITFIMGSISGPIFLTRIRKLNVLTVGDFFALRYPENQKIVRLLVSFSMLSRNTSIIGAQFSTVAFFISMGFNIDFHKALFLSGALIIFYTAVGGLRGVASTHIMQGLFQIIGLPLLLVYVVKNAGGLSDIVYFYGEIDGLSYLNIFGGSSKFTEMAFLIFAPGLFFIIEDQSTWQRIISTKNDKVAFWGYTAPLGAALIWLLIPCLVGVFTKAIFPSFTAYPVAFLDFLFSLPETATLFIIFSILSASVSTCDSYLLASGVIFSQDIVHKIFFVNSSRNLVTVTRIGIVISGIVGLYASTRIFDVFELHMAGAYIGGSILTVPYLLTWFSRRMNGMGIITGMLAGVATFVLLLGNFNYSETMLLSMIANVIVASIVCLLFNKSKESAINETYYFSDKFKGVHNIPR